MVSEEVKEVGLNRYYDPSNLSRLANSVYEFKHEFAHPRSPETTPLLCRPWTPISRAVDGETESFVLRRDKFMREE